VEEKKKQRKDKSSRYPGGTAAKNVETQPDDSVEGKDKKEVSVCEDDGAAAMEKLKLEKEWNLALPLVV
jgi:hypothetical protein